MPEIGLSYVSTVEEVRDKIRSSETRRQLNEAIKVNDQKEAKKSDVHYKDLMTQRLDTIQK